MFIFETGVKPNEKNILISLLIVLSSFCFGQDGENYIWNINSLNGMLGNKTKIVFGEEMHYNTDQDKIDYNHTDLIFYRQLDEKFTFGMGFRNARSGGKDNWENEFRPMLYGVYRTIFKEVVVKFRGRIGYRNFENHNSYFRYQNQISLTCNETFTRFYLRPYFTNQLYFSLDETGFNKVRLFGGINALNISFLNVQLYYCKSFVEQAETWNSYNITGINLNFQI